MFAQGASGEDARTHAGEAWMDLKSGYPWWVVRNGLLGDYGVLAEDLDCDVLVIGAGITGALIADELARAGLRTCVVDRRDAGWGSTAASTALLQYEIDVELAALTRKIGADDALLAYRACADAVRALLELARAVGRVGARPVRSLYLASRGFHRTRLRQEATLRQAHGFEVEVLEAEALRARFGLDAPLALLTEPAAVVDPYRFAHRLLARVRRHGGRVHDRTGVAEFRARRGGVDAMLDNGARVRCAHLVVAAGYEGQRYLDQRVARNRSSYAFITDPLPAGQGPLRDCVVWESARPYLYARGTSDGRVLLGGEDDRIDLPARRDARL
ncbi:MAG TPA: FAD-dependent oxidoreductase, partial [Dokdonella sp.]